MYNFRQIEAHWVMDPFYNDHTAYGSALAMFIPILIGFSFSSYVSKNARIASIIMMLLYIFAIILSYTRAAWLSLFVSLIVYLILLFKIKLRVIAMSILGLGLIFFTFHNDINIMFNRNKQGSTTDYIKHLKSMYNVSTDPSNRERLNRWHCAIKMFREKPIFGWGPGTYQFKYAPFQVKKEKTIISTNTGLKGNAHNEYLGPLSESGMLGFISILLIVFSTIYTAIRVYKTTKIGEKKLLSLIILLGLITYFTHGLINNFLDTDKASAPFWGFIAAITILDITLKDESI
jgi:O-antigen ligase